MEYKYNELEYGKLVFEKGFQTGFIKYELLILVKYLKYKNYNKKDTEKFIYSFCKKYIEGYNDVKYYKVIDKAILEGRKKGNNLIVIDKIDVYKAELGYIDKLEISNDYKKILLTFLINKKISNKILKINREDENIPLSIYFEGNKKKYNEIYKQSKIKDKYDINTVLSELVKNGLIISIKKGDIVLSYIEDIEKLEKKEVFHELKPVNFDEVGWLFDYYKGENNIKLCENCGCLIKQNNNKTKYCKECSKEIKLENDRKIQRERYQNKISRK